MLDATLARRRRAATANGSRRRSSASGATRSPRSRRDLRVWVRQLPRRRRVAPDVLRVQLRPVRRGARSAQRQPSRSWSTAASACAARSISSSSSADGAQLRVTDHKTGKNRTTPRTMVDRRRRHAAAGALRPGDREGHRRRRSSRDGCSTAPRPAASPSTRFRSTTTRGAPGSRRSRSSIARSSWASCRRRRPSAPARGATSGRCAAGRGAARRAQAAGPAGRSQALRDMP